MRQGRRTRAPHVGRVVGILVLVLAAAPQTGWSDRPLDRSNGKVSITVSPWQNLADTHQVSVTGTGWPSGQFFRVLQCSDDKAHEPPTPEPGGGDIPLEPACRLAGEGTTAADGTLAISVTVLRTYTIPNGFTHDPSDTVTITCQATEDCYLEVNNFTTTSPPQTPMRFADHPIEFA